MIDTPSYVLSENIREHFERMNPTFTVMPDGYIPMRTRPSSDVANDPRTRPSADVANDPFTLTEAKCDLVYGSGDLLHIHCPL